VNIEKVERSYPGNLKTKHSCCTVLDEVIVGAVSDGPACFENTLIEFAPALLGVYPEGTLTTSADVSGNAMITMGSPSVISVGQFGTYELVVPTVIVPAAWVPALTKLMSASPRNLI
jgi:hypothetical protein